MLDFSIPAFGETDFLQSMENPRTQITKICAADGELYAAYGRLLRENGFSAREGTRTEPAACPRKKASYSLSVRNILLLSSV